MNLGTELLASVRKRSNEYKTLGDKTLAQLTEAQIGYQPAETSNSIAVIIRHMHGNMLSRWTNFLTEDGEKPWRQRDAEFEQGPATKEELLQRWEEGWRIFLHALASLTEEDLLKTVTIRTQPLVVIDAINRQLAHYSYHVGQIVYLGKWFQQEAWQPLTIARGESEAYHQKLKEQTKKNP